MSREKKLQIPFSDSELVELFSGSEECAIWLFPLFNFDFSMIFPSDDILAHYFETKKSDSATFTQQDLNLLQNTIIATPRPEYIRGIGTDGNREQYF